MYCVATYQTFTPPSDLKTDNNNKVSSEFSTHLSWVRECAYFIQGASFSPPFEKLFFPHLIYHLLLYDSLSPIYMLYDPYSANSTGRRKLSRPWRSRPCRHRASAIVNLFLLFVHLLLEKSWQLPYQSDFIWCTILPNFSEFLSYRELFCLQWFTNPNDDDQSKHKIKVDWRLPLFLVQTLKPTANSSSLFTAELVNAIFVTS